MKTNPHDGLWQDAPEPPFRFVLEQTFGDGEGEGMLSGVGSVAVDGQGNVYVFDSRASRIVSYAPDGSLRWSSGAEGEGPGEFTQPRGMVYDGGSRLYVTNLGGSRIDRFDLAGRYVDSHPSESIDAGISVSIVGTLGTDTLIASASIPAAWGRRLMAISLGGEWTVEREFAVVDSAVTGLSGGIRGFMPATLVDGRIVLGASSEYRLRVMDTAGRLLRVVTREGIDMTPPHVSDAGGGVTLAAFSSVSVDARVRGFTLVTGHWPAPPFDPEQFLTLALAGNAPELIRRRTADVFDADWNLLYSFEGADVEDLGPPGSVVAVDAESRIYASMPDGVTLGRYRMEVVEP